MADLRTVLVLCILLLLSHSAFQQSTAPLNSRAERVALLQLRSSLGLRSREWPIKGDPCLIWSGIQCSNGSVTGINISGFKRTRIGNLNPQFSVDALANFTLLSSFNASKFALPGQIPEWFGQRLIALQVLDLRSCSIRGPIPSTLGDLTNLTALYLSENGLTGIIPSTLGQLSSLSVLDLAQNSLTGSIPFSFSSLSNITFLDMSSNFVSGPIPLAIGTLFNLQILNLSNNSLSSSIPVQLGDLSSLVDLDLSSNSLSGSLPQDLRGLRNLQRMVIGRNLLTGSLPGNLFPPLTQLQFIALNHNNFTGQIPNVLWSMPQLRFLDASTNNFTGTLPNPNPSPNTSAAVFNLSHNLLYGTLSSILARFNFIDLSGNYFQGNIPDRTTTNVSLDSNCLQNISNQRTSAECSSFYTERGLTFDNFGIPIAPPPPQPSRRGNNRNKRVYILAGVLGGLGLIAVLVALLVLLILCSRKRNNTNQRSVGVGPVPTGGASPSLPPGATLDFSSLGESFTFQQILQATSEFSDLNLIKHGHSGDLYRGLLTGIPVVIKKVDLGTVKKESYMIELDFFNKVSHPRLVPLLGHCLEKENEKFLVYKYMPNRDLSSSLFWRNDTDEDRLQSLDWITRLKIATGAAESVSYLHHECHPPLVHRDVQASSILLDDKYEVRLGSLSDVCAQEGDVHQSRITRFLRLPTTSEQGASGTHTATCAYDVYCFGKVLLELVTGKLGISASSANGSTSKDWMESTLPYISIYDKELVTNIVDPTLIIDEDLLEEVWAMAVVARSCLNPKPSRRPLMRYVLKALENPVKVVREENTSSARLRATSSRGSWNAGLFGGSWRQSSSDVAAAPKVEGGGSRTTGSQGSGGHNGGGADNSSSTRRHSSRDICPEPLDVERLHED